MNKLILIFFGLLSSFSIAQVNDSSNTKFLGLNFYQSYATLNDHNAVYNPYFGLNYKYACFTAGPIVRIGDQAYSNTHFDFPIPGFLISCQLYPLGTNHSGLFFLEYNIVFIKSAYDSGYFSSLENLLGIGFGFKIQKKFFFTTSFGLGMVSYNNKDYIYSDSETYVSAIFKLSLGYLIK